MNKHNRTKLHLERDTIRHLQSHDLTHARGGGSLNCSEAGHSLCFAGCSGGGAGCVGPVSGNPADCWPDIPPR